MIRRLAAALELLALAALLAGAFLFSPRVALLTGGVLGFVYAQTLDPPRR